MENCVNINSEEFKNLLKEFNINPNILAAKVSVWQDEFGIDKFPTKEDIELHTNTFNNITRDVKSNVHPVLSTKQVNEINSALVFAGLSDIKELKDVESSINYAKIENELIKKLKSIRDDSSMSNEVKKELASRYMFILDSDYKLYNFWKKQIVEYIKSNFKIKKLDVDQVDDTLDEDEDGNNKVMEKDSNLESKHLKATENIKYILGTVPDIKEYNNGQIIYNKEEFLQLPKFKDAGQLWNSVSSLLAPITQTRDNGVIQDGYKLMIGKLKENAKYKPELAWVANKVDKMSETVQSQFFKTFSLSKSNYLNHTIDTRGGSPISKFTDSNVDSKEKAILDSWISNFEIIFGTYNEEGNLIYNINTIEYIKELARVYNVAFSEDVKKNQLSTETINKLSNLLGNLGVQIQEETINKLLDDTSIGDNQRARMFALREFNIKFYNTLKELNNIKPGTLLTFNNNVINNNKSFYRDILAEAQSYFLKVAGEDSFVGPDGNRIYILDNHNTISLKINDFKNGDLDYLKDLSESDFSSGSLWLNQMLDPEEGSIFINNLKLINYGNFIKKDTVDENSDLGDKASNLKTSDIFVDQFNKQLAGYYIGLAEADKSKQSYIYGPPLIKSSIGVTQNGVIFTNPDNEATQILIKYLSSELKRMYTAWEAMYGENKLNDNELILYYHYYPGSNDTKLPGNAFKSFLFPNLNLEELGLKIADIDGVIGNVLPDKIAYETLSTNKDTVAYMNSVLTKSINEDIQYAIDNNLIKKIINESNNKITYSNNAISYNFLTERGYGLDENINTQAIFSAIADYTINSIVGNVEQTMLFNMDAALYKVKLAKNKVWAEQDIFADLKKRIPAVSASGKQFRIFSNQDGVPIVREFYHSAVISNIEVGSSFFSKEDENGNISFNEDSINNIVNASWNETLGVTKEKYKDEIEKLFKPYLNINQTDAQAWITLDSYRERLNGIGEWTSTHEDIYWKIKNNEVLSFSDKVLLAQPLKTVHVEVKKHNQNVMNMHYNKQSEAVLLPFLTIGTPLDNLRLAMEAQDVDHVIVLDGKKVGATGIVSILNEDGSIKDKADIQFNPTKLSYKGLFLQQELPPHGVSVRQVGIQAVKNVMAVVEKNEEGMEMISDYHHTISKLSNLGLISLKNKLGYRDDIGFIKDENGKSKFYETIYSEFYGELSTNHLNAIKNEYPLDAIPIKDKLQNKLNALVTKKAIKLEQLGGAFIQMSDLGLVGSQVDLNNEVRDNIIWFKDPKDRLKPMNIDEKGVNPAQVLLPYNKIIEDPRFIKLIESKFEGKSYKELTHEQIKLVFSKEVLEGLSYRIPNQGPSSNDAFEIVGLLPPSMGDTIVMFSDITTKTGSDFDIDKAFIVLPNYYYDKESDTIKTVKYDPDHETKEGLENYRLDLMRNMLLNPNAFVDVMSPLDDPWLENIAKKLYPDTISKNDLQFFKGSYQQSVKYTFDTAKSLVGVIANHMSNQSLFLHEDISFNGYYLGKGIKNSNNESNISNRFDEDNNSIASTLGAFMNAIVDAAKDPFIARANINHYTAGIAFMLARSGVSREWIVSFMGQPIIKDLVKEINKSEGRFGIDEFKKGKKQKPIDIVKSKYGIDAVSNLKNPNGDITISKEELIKNIEIGSLELNISNSTEYMDYFNDQGLILGQFLEWQTKAKDLNKLIQLTKVDASGATRNLNRAKLFMNLYDTLKEENLFNGIDSMLGYSESNNMIGTYINNGPKAALEMFSNIFIQSTPAVQNLVFTVLENAGYINMSPTQKNEFLVDLVSNEIYTALISETELLSVTNEELKAIFFGDPNIKTEIGSLKSDRKHDLAIRINYAKLGGLSNNLLISSLTTQVSNPLTNTPCKISLPKTENLKTLKDDIYRAWEELHEIDSYLALDLIRYSFYTTGFTGVKGFYEHIPISILEKYNFSNQIKNLKYDLNINSFAADHVVDKVFKNLSYSNEIVPNIKVENRHTIVDGDGTVYDINDGFVITLEDGESYVVGYDENMLPVFKRFLKTKDGKLFQLQGYTDNLAGGIYIKVGNLGYKDRGMTIKEYNTDNTSIINSNITTVNEKLSKLLENTVPLKKVLGSYENIDDYRVENPEDIDTIEKLNYCKK